MDGDKWNNERTWACFLSLAQSKLRLCLANHRAGYFSNLACDWLSVVWAYSEPETENVPRWNTIVEKILMVYCTKDTAQLHLLWYFFIYTFIHQNIYFLNCKWNNCLDINHLQICVLASDSYYYFFGDDIWTGYIILCVTNIQHS